MLETLDAAAVHRWCDGGLEALRAHQHEIDELNVYPVPDGDTGTNLVLTLTAAREALTAVHSGLDATPPPAARARRSAPCGSDAEPHGRDEVPYGRDAELRWRDAEPHGRDAELRWRYAEPQGRDAELRWRDAELRGRDADSPGRDSERPLPQRESERSSRERGGGSSPRDQGSGSGLANAAPSDPMRRMARGALLGARGNSGVIVSQILRGMADTFAVTVVVRGTELARALRTATDAAYAAVARPVEGTVLSVVAAAADAAGRIGSDNLVAVARAASTAAAEALARTPQQLPVLARAGVVDAGGRGLCLLLDALVAALDPQDDGDPAARGEPGCGTGAESTAGTAPPEHSSPVDSRACDVGHAHGGVGGSGFHDGVDGSGLYDGVGGSGLYDGAGGPGYEVQYLLDAPDEEVARLRTTLAGIGDSLVVVGTGEGDPPTWNVHVHVTEIGPAIEAGIEAGRPYRISVNPLTGRLPHVDRRGAVVVAAGDGLTALFEAEGAVVVDRNPSTAEMLAAIEVTGATAVVLLPNDANTHAVAISAAREAGRGTPRGPARQVSVVPTRSPVQALAALAVRDEQRPFADDVIAMAEAAGACRYGEVCTAQRDALTVAGPCRAGDLLGLVDGEVHVIGGDLAEVSRSLLDRMLGGGGELVTLVLGADAPPGVEEDLRGHVHRTWPFVELLCYAGGQPRYHLLAGVE